MRRADPGDRAFCRCSVARAGEDLDAEVTAHGPAVVRDEQAPFRVRCVLSRFERRSRVSGLVGDDHRVGGLWTGDETCVTTTRGAGAFSVITRAPGGAA